MSIKAKLAILEQALKALGVKNAREVTTDDHTRDVGNVYVNGEYFGAFDFIRKTVKCVFWRLHSKTITIWWAMFTLRLVTLRARHQISLTTLHSGHKYVAVT